jgi:ribonucleotide reductase alpha subunit
MSNPNPVKEILLSDGNALERFNPAKLRNKIEGVADSLGSPFVDKDLIYNKVYEGLNHIVHKEKVYDLLSETAAYMATQHPDYGYLAARFVLSKIYNQTRASFSECVEQLYMNVNVITKSAAPLVSDEFYAFVQ